MILTIGLCMQAANTSLQQQAAALQRMLAGGESAALARAQELQQELLAREAEGLALRQRAAVLQQQVQQAQQRQGSAEAQQLQEQVRQLQQQNEELTAELAAFEPEFFEEIEDLKHEHHQLTVRCAEHEHTIQQLRAQQAA